uniref:Secreted protein n=1 Tax=Anguilla anguilla TaxID=7936 RepID=A0A0E9RPX8_ANGAN
MPARKSQPFSSSYVLFAFSRLPLCLSEQSTEREGDNTAMMDKMSVFPSGSCEKHSNKRKIGC